MVNVRNFNQDLKDSNNPLLLKEWERVLKMAFGDKSDIHFDDSLNVQLGYGTDCTVKFNGRRYSVELKTRNSNTFKKSDYIMEIVHHIYNNENKDILIKTKSGWIYTTTAEYIFHATLNQDKTKIIELIAYSLSPFKYKTWGSNFNQYNDLWLNTRFSNGNFQTTLNKLIPKHIIEKNADKFGEMTKVLGAEVFGGSKW